jgi:hypothetical protein
VDAFDLYNLTGDFSLPPDFPVTDGLTFGEATLTLTLSDLSQDVFNLGDIGPGFLLDDNGNPIVQLPGDEVIDSAEFKATLSPITFALSDGTEFTTDSSSIDVLLLPSIGSTLTVDVDQALIGVTETVPTGTPEPASGDLVLLPPLARAGVAPATKARSVCESSEADMVRGELMIQRHGTHFPNAVALAVLFCPLLATAQTAVTLLPASPTSGLPDVTVKYLTGSGFPPGTIQATEVAVSLKPSAGGTVVTTPSSAVAVIVGSTRRVTFTIPASISVAAPTAYAVSISGTTTTNAAFASTNTAALTVNPGAQVLSAAPATGYTGQTLSVTITGAYTNFVQGSTVASFGAGISVGGAAEGASGPVAISSATVVVAQLVIDPAASIGTRNVSVNTGAQTATLTAGFNVGLNPNPTHGWTISGAFSVFNSTAPTLNISADPPAGASMPTSAAFSVFNGIAPLSNMNPNPSIGEISAFGLFSLQNGQTSQSGQLRAQTADTNGNGLPDVVKRALIAAGINPDPNAVSGGDGLTNRQKYCLGNDPTKAGTDPASQAAGKPTFLKPVEPASPRFFVPNDWPACKAVLQNLRIQTNLTNPR